MIALMTQMIISLPSPKRLTVEATGSNPVVPTKINNLGDFAVCVIAKPDKIPFMPMHINPNFAQSANRMMLRDQGPQKWEPGVLSKDHCSTEP